MSEDPVDQTMMAELAKLWEDDHDVQGLSNCCGPAALTTCHGGGGTAGQLHPLDSRRERDGASGDTSISDPFILPGDEQTWDQDEWFLDPATLMAAPRETLQAQNHPCCQALKRRKLPPEILPALGHSTDSAADAMSSMPGTSSQHAATHAGSPAPTLNCCSFQMPHMHLPSGLVTTGQGLRNPFNMDQGMAPTMQHPHASMLPGIASGIWPQPGTNSHPQGMINASQPNILAALQQQLALPELQAASAALLASQCPKPGHLHSGLDAAVVPSHPNPPTVVGPSRASGLPPRSSQPQLSMTKHSTKIPSPGRPAALSAAPGESDAGSDSEGEGAACFAAVGTTAISGITASTSGSVAPVAGAAVGRGRGVVLQPATYTGSLEDVVSLSDQCPDEAARMMCQVAGCGKDLSGFKEYHQRYRICDVHIKLPQVLKDGRLQRFCQQCGRFHDLAAFDANRKSCREQLNKHNARRRRRAQIEAQKSKAMEQLSGATGLATALTAGGTGGGGGGNGNGNNNPAGDIPADAAGINSAVAAVAAAGDGTNDVGRLLSALMQNPTHLHALRLLLGVQTHPALPPMHPFVPDIPPALVPSGVDPSSVDGAGASPASAQPDPPSYGLARDVVDCKGPWSAGFESDHRGLRISMKLFNRTPADLPTDLRQQVTGWLASMPTALAGAIRPGCVFLTLHLLLSRTAYANTIKRGLSSLLNHLRTRTGCSLWHKGAYVVQMGWEMALVAGGKVTAYYHDPSGPAPAQPVALEAVTPSSHAEMVPGAPPRPPRQYPMVSDVTPLCVCAPKPSGSAVLKMSLRGTGLSAPGVELVVRQQGTQLRLPLTIATNGLSATAEIPFHRDAPEVASHATAPACANRATALTSCGVVWIEVARGAWMSPPRPLLILDDPALVNEVSELLKPNCRAELSGEERDALLVDLGMVLAHVSAGTGTPAGQDLDVQHHRHHHDHHKRSHGVTDCFSGMDHSTVSLKARRLLLFACDMGWAGVAARVLPLATGSCDCAAEMVAAVHASSAAPAACAQQRGSGGGLSLLHRVVRSGNLALLQGVLHWGVVAGYAWRADRNGPGGITPLHLAALQEDPRILLALFEYAPRGAFTCLQAQDGTTPFHLAFQMGHFSLNQLTNLLADEKLLPSDRLSSVLAAAARSNSACGTKLTTSPGVGMGVTGVATTCGEVITASGPQGREVDPCTKCHCRLPPLVLSIAAACAACGSSVPCLGALPTAADADGSKGAAADDVGRAVPGHDADRCAGCTTEQQLLAVAAAAVAGAGVVGSLTGRKRPLSELSALSTAGEVAAGHWGMGTDCANNCAGVVAEVPGKAAENMCGHHKGSVFSITALCQGCHANRVLEVM